ncbi:MAG TPA: sulfatase-like hydrolase/transferase [Bryobacteraceae bacterium]|jgi:arylsulfatase A-like enzyme|nr:sulfatase-like hydrolase/transferase [Bryobacteraceae bacterium]
MLVSRRTFFFGSLALPLAAKTTKKKVEALRPGILLILADELPAFALGSYGNKQIRTPTLDVLAQMGMRFTNHFACAPAVVPGRNTLLTGCTPMQLGDAGTLSAADIPLAKILGPAGYTCQEGDAAATLQFLDTQTAGKPFFFTMNCPSLRPPYDAVPQKYLDLYASEPFDGYAPDLPAAGAADGKEMLRNILGNVKKAAATLTFVDDTVKTVLAKLRARGLADSTLVVFTSSTGALWGRHGLWDSANASEPPNMFEEAVGTPMMWSWPGHIPAIAHRPELVSAYDFVPSVCQLLSLETPARNLCGRSYVPLVEVKELPKKSPWVMSVCAHSGNTDMSRENRYKLVSRNDDKGPNELYDLAVDPTERENQAGNPQFLTIHNELAGILAAWKKDYSTATPVAKPEANSKKKQKQPKAKKTK